MSRYYIGVDPGVSGGWAMVDERGALVLCMGMPDSPATMVGQALTFREQAVLDCRFDTGLEIRALVERVHASPPMGVVSAFTSRMGKGCILTALAAAKIPVDEITPQQWQKVMGVIYPSKKERGGKPRDKNVSKRRAEQVFPGQKITHANADALLLAECARRINRTAAVPPR